MEKSRDFYEKPHIHKKKAAVYRVGKEKTGFTLVELIVTFALLLLFTTGTCRVMADSMRVYYKIRGLNDSQQVMDMLMEKITGEIEGAQKGMENAVRERDTLMRISSDHKTISFSNRSSSYITISAAPMNETEAGTQALQYLNLHYRQVRSASDETIYKDVDWKFDAKAYLGFSVKDLKFARADEGGDYRGNVIRVTLTITAPEYGDFTSVRYVECYNYQEELDWTRIVQE